MAFFCFTPYYTSSHTSDFLAFASFLSSIPPFFHLSFLPYQKFLSKIIITAMKKCDAFYYFIKILKFKLFLYFSPREEQRAFPCFQHESSHISVGCGNSSLRILQLVSRRYSILNTYCYLLFK